MLLAGWSGFPGLRCGIDGRRSRGFPAILAIHLRFQFTDCPRDPLLGRPEVLGPNPIDGRFHLLHLVGDLRVGHPGVLHVVQEPLDAVPKAVARFIEPPADLTLHDRRFSEPISGFLLDLTGRVELVDRLSNGGHGELLHLEDPFNFFPDLAPAVIQLASVFFLGDDPDSYGPTAC
jgi:hypothetical protein